MLNKYYFSSANRLLRKNTGHGVRADVPTHARSTEFRCCLQTSAYRLTFARNTAGRGQRLEISWYLQPEGQPGISQIKSENRSLQQSIKTLSQA